MSRDNLAYNPRTLRKKSNSKKASAAGAAQRGRIMARPKMSPESRLYYQQKARYERETGVRKRRYRQMGLCLLAVSLMVGLVLYHQSRVLSDGYDNAELKREINLLQIENSQKESEILAGTNMEEVIERAIKLGFKDPGSDQIIYLNVPRKDRLDLGTNTKGQAPVAESYDRTLDKLEAYYRDILP